MLLQQSFFLQTLIYSISRDGSKNFNLHTCEHIILGQLRIGARPAKNAALPPIVTAGRFLLQEHPPDNRDIVHCEAMCRSILLVKINISNLKGWSNMSLNDIKSYLKANFELSLLCYFSFEIFCLCYFLRFLQLCIQLLGWILFLLDLFSNIGLRRI